MDFSTLLLRTDPKKKAHAKTRVFSVQLLAFLTTDSLWEPGSASTKNSLRRPVWIAYENDPQAGGLLAEYYRLQNELLRRIRSDRFIPERAGRLLDALVELPSYLDRSTDDQLPFEIRYPEALAGELVAMGKSFPSSARTPKESWLLARVAAHLRDGAKVLVFLRHTGTPELPARLLKLLSEVTPQVAWLDAKKVPTDKREAWIDQHVLAKDCRSSSSTPTPSAPGSTT